MLVLLKLGHDPRQRLLLLLLLRPLLSGRYRLLNTLKPFRNSILPSIRLEIHQFIENVILTLLVKI